MTYETPAHHKFEDLRPDFIQSSFRALNDLLFTWSINTPNFHLTAATMKHYVYLHRRSLKDEYYKHAPIHKSSLGIKFCSQSDTDGDACIYSGLASISGYPEPINTIIHSQDENGRMWRSPNRVGIDPECAYSRDQLFGLLVYSVNSGNPAPLRGFMEYYNKNQKMCEPCHDNRCKLLISTKGILYRVCKRLKIEVPRHWWFFNLIDKLGQVASAYTSKAGYRLHLVAISVFINQCIGKRTRLDNLAIGEIYKRQPDNLFFEYLARGPRLGWFNKIRNMLPTDLNNTKDLWVFGVDTNYNRWKNTMLWDWIFILSLIDVESNDVVF